MLVQPHRASAGAALSALAEKRRGPDQACRRRSHRSTWRADRKNQQEIVAFRYAKTTDHLNLLKILHK